MIFILKTLVENMLKNTDRNKKKESRQLSMRQEAIPRMSLKKMISVSDQKMIWRLVSRKILTK